MYISTIICIIVGANWQDHGSMRYYMGESYKLYSLSLHMQSLRNVIHYYASHPNNMEGVNAVRYQQYKAHFITKG